MRPLVLSLMVLAGAGMLRGDDSPFLPPAGAKGPLVASGRGADGSGYELRGIMSTGALTKYCIFDPARKASVWLGMNETAGTFSVKAADPVRETVTLEAGGQRLTLALHEAKVVSLAGGGALPAPSPGGGLAPVVLRPTPEDEQRRLQAIAEEVRRRRQMREQAQSR